MAPHKVTSSDSKRPVPETWQMGTESFNHRMSHHDGVKALWETKWRLPCTKSVYPFHDGSFEDFEPIFTALISSGINDGADTAYTEAFFPTAASLENSGDEAMASGKKEEASKLYLRAACVLRIARFPYITGFNGPSCPVKWRAWEMQKKVYMKAASAWSVPIKEVEVPHIHAQDTDRGVIPAYVRVPNTQTRDGSHPTVLLFTGLDGYRPDNTGRCDEFLARGWASVTVEIPGTADCPADPADPTSPDRLWDSVFDWMCADGRFDMRRVVCWGLSSGGYYAVRVAHTHREQLAGVVAQGAGTHYFFAREWLEKAEGHEYPFELLPALARKHGFDDVESYLDGALKKFSLLETGVLEKPCAKLLLVNGTLDGLMPIEDSSLLFEYGSPKEARFFPRALHMGYPMANSSVYPWMEEVLGSAK
ncbi:Alpha/Beta hydrolase protein [Xylaria bambusicola]|uniref:Alpha/Beta hydrolase protein n=1 Tax=Xylaria bambusicola TaxID=326684 RepID=UPI0020080E33|nr:Alpha/Beta hydrolase protein [Xylaria bambusicola]KAI0503218.1 Alpha/Beta hydrolase protein [Xylaria bambusicola]